MDETPTQLVLRVDRPDWRLDERTREVGRRGLAQARAAMRAARRRSTEVEARRDLGRPGLADAGPANAA